MLPALEPETPVYRWIYAALRTEILEARADDSRRWHGFSKTVSGPCLTAPYPCFLDRCRNW